MAMLFVYGTSLPGQPDHRWIAGLPLAPATVRGSLWRGPRNRPALLAEDGGRPIRGALLEIEDGRLAVLDLVETAGEGVLVRRMVRASTNLRPVHAHAWVIDKPPRGWRKLATDDWAGSHR
ncbi:MAG: gamma-glutamylcyclotransferase [Myxococcales bacterium]